MVDINSKFSRKSLTFYTTCALLPLMKKTSIKTSKRGTNFPKKKSIGTEDVPVVPQKTGIPAYLEPTEYDLHDELSRLDSFTYARYNN